MQSSHDMDFGRTASLAFQHTFTQFLATHPLDTEPCAAINAAYASGDVNTSKGDKAEQGPSGSLDGAVSASYAEA